MQKKSKLAIKHYYGKELEKIGKSSTGFPLYVMVRYKNVKTKFASRIGMKFVKDYDGDFGALDRELSRIKEDEVNYIEMLRNYFEDSLEVEFTPSMIVNEAYEKVTLERVVDYFDSIFEDREVKEILWGINQDLAELYEVAGPIRFLSALRHLDSVLFSRIMNIPTVRMLAFYREYPDDSILPQPVAKLPWGHNILLIEKIKEKELRFWYAEQCLTNNWSRDILDTQIKTNLFGRVGKSVNNFEETLPAPLSDLANQTLKDPYIFDFLTLDAQHRERDIEKQLIQHITQFLLELGKGFAFIGNQYHLKVGESDYYLDLLFYHTRLKCYVVIELKNTRFIPEYAGKLNFYLSAVDTMVKDASDNPTIGILLCKDKSNIEVEFALRDINKPMGVSELKLVENLPDNLKASLPTIEEIEVEFDKIKK